MPLNIILTELKDLIVIEPRVFGDARGFFFESFNQRDFSQILGHAVNFVQDNHSKSNRGVLRGLHYQTEQVQGKLVRVIQGSVFDVAVDLRRSSPSFGKWFGIELSAQNKKQLWIPPGFAHGFLVLSENAEFLYKTTDYWHSSSEQTLLWNDPSLKISWPNLGIGPQLSEKDSMGCSWAEAPKFS